MAKNLTLGELIDLLEDFLDEYPQMDTFPVLVSEDADDGVDGLLTGVDTDGHNIILSFEGGL